MLSATAPIVNSSGTKVVEYLYDSWGKLISTTGSLASTVGVKNPYRYRGYRYDTETGLYYLQSRYYDPLAKRFVNADGYVSTGQGVLGNNMFAYCGNNPVNCIDKNGQFWFFVPIIVPIIIVPIILIIVSVVSIIDGLKNIVIDNQEGVNDAEKEVAKDDPIGALMGNEAKNIANDYQKELYPNTYSSDANQANAFKHAMWNAVMTDMMGKERAEKFANAHEEPYLAIYPELCEMDLHNNALGREIATQYSGEGYDVFAEKIQEAINGGEACVIKWDEGN